jgi:hypothetical protein
MNILVDDLARAVLKKPIADCSIDELRRLCQQYPYFGPIHIIYTQKLKQQDDSLLNVQLQKTSLYFTNPLWLDYLLSEPATVVKSYPENQSFHIEKKAPEFEEIKEIIEEPAESISELAENNPLIADEAGEELTSAQNLPVVEIHEDVADEVVEKEEIETVNLPSLENKIKFEPVNPSSDALTFEPFHTVDYFASQGIKPKEDNKPVDRFSQQLKSFTEWLKTMKKIPVSEIGNTSETAGESKVEQMAAQSITDRDVVTEAMAEVWEKQGDKAKATEIYRKLSLLDPAKSAYFAAKIEALK